MGRWSCLSKFQLDLGYHQYLLQCILYAAMYALKKAPPLTDDQLSRAPEGLKLYYQGYEETVLGHLMRWEIMPVVENSSGPLYAFYNFVNNTLVTTSASPYLSLYNLPDLSTIYHELFHAYQDSTKASQGSVFVELHAQLIGCLTVLRIEETRKQQQKRSFDVLQEETRSWLIHLGNKMESSQELDKDNIFSLVYGPNKEETIQAASYFWDWARAIMDKKQADPNLALKKDFILRERIKYVVVDPLASMLNELKYTIGEKIQIQLLEVSPDTVIQRLDVQRQKVEEALGRTYTKLGIDPLLEDKNAEVFKIMDSLLDEFLKDDLQYAEREKKHEEQYLALQIYFRQVAAKAFILSQMAVLLNVVGSPKADAAREEFNQFRLKVFNPLVNQYMGAFAPSHSDGIE